MIDTDGYRPNVGIIIVNNDGKLFWCRRIGQNAWQFPQGGIAYAESPEQAVIRELKEETGLQAEDVEIIARTDGWLRYNLPEHLVRHYKKPVCIGQKQKWFMFKLLADEKLISLNNRYQRPEFDFWQWTDYWTPVNEVVNFKREVYQQALEFFAPYLKISLKEKES